MGQMDEILITNQDKVSSTSRVPVRHTVLKSALTSDHPTGWSLFLTHPASQEPFKDLAAGGIKGWVVADEELDSAAVHDEERLCGEAADILLGIEH